MLLLLLYFVPSFSFWLVITLVVVFTCGAGRRLRALLLKRPAHAGYVCFVYVVFCVLFVVCVMLLLLLYCLSSVLF